MPWVAGSRIVGDVPPARQSASPDSVAVLVLFFAFAARFLYLVFRAVVQRVRWVCRILLPRQPPMAPGLAELGG